MERPDRRTMHKLTCSLCKSEVLYRIILSEDAKICKECLIKIYNEWRVNRNE